jgi:hypothetical protein
MTEATKLRRQPRAPKAPRPGHDPRRETAPVSSTSAQARGPDPIDSDTLDEAFLRALKADFIAHGDEAIAAMRSVKPVDYVKIVAALHTKEVGATTDPLPDMSDTELERHIEELAAQVGYEIRRIAAPRREDGEAGDAG